MEKVKVLKLSEITENTSKLVEIEDKKIAVFLSLIHISEPTRPY